MLRAALPLGAAPSSAPVGDALGALEALAVALLCALAPGAALAPDAPAGFPPGTGATGRTSVPVPANVFANSGDFATRGGAPDARVGTEARGAADTGPGALGALDRSDTPDFDGTPGAGGTLGAGGLPDAPGFGGVPDARTAYAAGGGAGRLDGRCESVFAAGRDESVFGAGRCESPARR